MALHPQTSPPLIQPRLTQSHRDTDFSTIGATAPRQENCRGCARAFCAVSAAASKQASCVITLVAWLIAICRQIGKAAPQHGKARKVEGRKSKVEGREGRALSRPQWPGRSRALPSPNFHIDNWQHWHWLFPHFHITQGRWLAQRGGVPVSQLRRGSALCASVSLCEKIFTTEADDRGLGIWYDGGLTMDFIR